MKTYRIRQFSLVWWIAAAPWIALTWIALVKWYELLMKFGGELVCWVG